MIENQNRKLKRFSQRSAKFDANLEFLLPIVFLSSTQEPRQFDMAFISVEREKWESSLTTEHVASI